MERKAFRPGCAGRVPIASRGATLPHSSARPDSHEESHHEQVSRARFRDCRRGAEDFAAPAEEHAIELLLVLRPLGKGS